MNIVSPRIAALIKNARQRQRSMSASRFCSISIVAPSPGSEVELAVDTLSNDADVDQWGEGAKWMPWN